MIDLVIFLLYPMLYFVHYANQLKALPTSVQETERYGILLVAVLILFPFALVGFFADIVMNNTTVPFTLKGGWFQEWTFSTRLERLCVQDDSELMTKQLCIEIALAINRVCPTHDHIEAVLPKVTVLTFPTLV